MEVFGSGDLIVNFINTNAYKYAWEKWADILFL